MKLLGALILSTTGTCIGINAVAKLKKRADSLNWYYKAILQIGSKIGGTAAELYDIVNTICGREEYLELSTPFNIGIKPCGINKDDQLTILEFFNSLGFGEIEWEVKTCQLYSTLIQERYKNAHKEYLEKSKLYKMLGLFSGLAAAIILM